VTNWKTLTEAFGPQRQDALRRELELLRAQVAKAQQDQDWHVQVVTDLRDAISTGPDSIKVAAAMELPEWIEELNRSQGKRQKLARELEAVRVRLANCQVITRGIQR
jgi:hypothetical protein